MKNLLLILGLVLISNVNIYACSCTEIRESLGKKLKNAFVKADVIFTGKVIDITEINTILPYKSSADPVIYKFEIIAKIKGEIKTNFIEVLSEQSGSSCGYSFQLGESYLVYSSSSDHFSSKTGIESSFVTSLCRRNQKLKLTPKKELKKLKRLSKIENS